MWRVLFCRRVEFSRRRLTTEIAIDADLSENDQCTDGWRGPTGWTMVEKITTNKLTAVLLYAYMSSMSLPRSFSLFLYLSLPLCVRLFLFLFPFLYLSLQIRVGLNTL